MNSALAVSNMRFEALRVRWLPCLIAIAVVTLARATVAANLAYQVTKTPAGTLECTVLSGERATEAAIAQIDVKVPQGYGVKKLILASGEGGRTVEVTPSPGSSQMFSAKISADDLSRREDSVKVIVTVSDTAATERSVTCDASFRPLFQNSSSSPEDPPGVLDRAALTWWIGAGAQRRAELTAVGEKLGLPTQTVLVVHLPSGAPAFPFPAALTEGTPIQVAIIMPQNLHTAVTMEVTSCEDVHPFRTELEEKKDEKKSNFKPTDSSEAASEFELVPVGQFFACGAGKLNYKLQLGETGKNKLAVKEAAPKPARNDENDKQGKKDKAAEEACSCSKDGQETKIRIRPKYHVAAVALGGYDFAKRRSFETLRDALDPLKPPTIGQLDSSYGLSLYVGAVWMIGGIDYENLRWWNYFANVFIAVNVAAPLENGVVGLAVTPTGGVSLGVGVSLHATTRLRGGYAVGQQFSGDGDLPTETTWKDTTPGIFAGLAIDSRVYDAISARFKAQKE